MIETKDLVKDLADKYGRNRESLLPILQGVVEKEMSLGKEAMIEIAKELEIATAEVYGTASFYAFLDTEPRGKYIIRVCQTITCDMKGKKQIIKAIEDMLKVKLGETNSSGHFTLLVTNCLGWCHKAPAMLINDEVYTDLTVEKVKKIIGDLIRAKV